MQIQCSYKIEAEFFSNASTYLKVLHLRNKKRGKDMILKDYDAHVKTCHFAEIEVPRKDCRGLAECP